VDNLWAITSIVLFFPLTKRVSYILASLIKSRLLVASSKIINSDFFTKALASANLCFSPPDNPPPASSRKVSYLPGSFSINRVLGFRWSFFYSI
jgi:hypothetical protein